MSRSRALRIAFAATVCAASVIDLFGIRNSRDGRRIGRRGIALASLLAVVAGCGAAGPRVRPGSVPPVIPNRAGPESMMSEAIAILDDPVGTIAQLRTLGVDRVHLPLYWQQLAPDPAAVRRPAVDLADPGAYSASTWAKYDAVVRDLQAANIGIDLQIGGPPPRWASGPGAPQPAKQTQWRPNAADYELFVHAVGTRYSGHYTPPGARRSLPRVGFWSIWNEPDLGDWLAPEAVDHSQVEVAPHYYRSLVGAAWTALRATGHGRDTILIGELAPAGIRSGAGVGMFNSMPPLRFLRALYCLDSSYRPLRGQQATLRGCPSTANGSARFAAENPGLFHASGVADHPYPQGLAPDTVTPDEPDYAELAEIPHLENTLDRAQRVYGSSTRFPIWDTEFGYQTHPPDVEPGTVSPTTAAYYLNWAEYITYKDSPRLRSFDQYLLTDPSIPEFDSGLLTISGAPKPGYYAFRMPLYLPTTTAAKGRALDVWGGVRPAPRAAATTHRRQSVQIQFAPGRSEAFHTVQTVPLYGPHGYFEVRHVFPGTGQVRLAWRGLHIGETYSRTVQITLQ